MINTHWGGVVEDNSFGTHEFLNSVSSLVAKLMLMVTWEAEQFRKCLNG